MKRYFCDECNRELKEKEVIHPYLEYRIRIIDEWTCISPELCRDCADIFEARVETLMKEYYNKRRNE